MSEAESRATSLSGTGVLPVILTLLLVVMGGCTRSAPPSPGSPSPPPKPPPSASPQPNVDLVLKRRIDLGRTPAALAVESDRLWIATFGDPSGVALIIDPSSGEILQHIGRIGWSPTSIDAMASIGWVANTAGDESRPDSSFQNSVAEITNTAATAIRTIPLNHPAHLVATGTSVWVSSVAEHALFRIDAATARVADRVDFESSSDAYVDFWAGAIWAATWVVRGIDQPALVVARFDPLTGAALSKHEVPATTLIQPVTGPAPMYVTDRGIMAFDPTTGRADGDAFGGAGLSGAAQLGPYIVAISQGSAAYLLAPGTHRSLAMLALPAAVTETGSDGTRSWLLAPSMDAVLEVGLETSG
jgi:hypothetical protein